VKIELVPAPDPADPVSLAAAAAIEQTGLAADARPVGSTSAWWRAGVHEAVEPGSAPREHERGRAGGRGSEVEVGGPQPGTARERPSRPDVPPSA
jgi:hypothetical protein